MKGYARKGLRMSHELARWYEEKALELGITQNALMVMALNEFAKQEKSFLMVNELKSLMDNLREVKKE